MKSEVLTIPVKVEINHDGSAKARQVLIYTVTSEIRLSAAIGTRGELTVKIGAVNPAGGHW